MTAAVQAELPGTEEPRTPALEKAEDVARLYDEKKQAAEAYKTAFEELDALMREEGRTAIRVGDAVFRIKPRLAREKVEKDTPE